MYYIYENDKPNFICKMFNIIKLKGNKIILPKGEKNNKKQIQLAKKTYEIMKKMNNTKIVLSKKLQKQNEYLNQLQTYPLEICDGRWLFFMILPEILEYILGKQEIKREETTVHILANDISENVIGFIKLLTENYKTISVVTKHSEKLRKIENQILEETGTAITVMNNKRKSLLKAKFIINIDFPEEFINQYSIYENAIILDVFGNTKIRKKRFNGIVISDYDICIKNKEEYMIEEDLFYQKDLYEAEFYKKQPYLYVREKIKKDGMKISALYSLNGIILNFS